NAAIVLVEALWERIGSEGALRRHPTDPVARREPQVPIRPGCDVLRTELDWVALGAINGWKLCELPVGSEAADPVGVLSGCLDGKGQIAVGTQRYVLMFAAWCRQVRFSYGAQGSDTAKAMGAVWTMIDEPHIPVWAGSNPYGIGVVHGKLGNTREQTAMFQS